MSKQEKLVMKIVAASWKFLQDWKNKESDPFYYDEERKVLSLIEDEGKEIPEGLAGIKLETWIKEVLENKEYSMGKVFLYTCGDNAMIALEKMEESEFKDAIEGHAFEKQEGFRNKFYIGYD